MYAVYENQGRGRPWSAYDTSGGVIRQKGRRNHGLRGFHGLCCEEKTRQGRVILGALLKKAGTVLRNGPANGWRMGLGMKRVKTLQRPDILPDRPEVGPCLRGSGLIAIHTINRVIHQRNVWKYLQGNQPSGKLDLEGISGTPQEAEV